MKLVVLSDYIKYQEAMLWFRDVSDGERNDLARCKDDFEKIIVFEHEDVYTAGKSVQNDIRSDKNTEEKTLINNVPVVYTDRGGLWTWHGRGQVVVYFIYDLRSRNMRLSDFMATVEDAVIGNVNLEIKRLTTKMPVDIGLRLYADSEKRGFWVKKINCYDHETAKFGFIGLRVSNGIVYHGISINYTNDLMFFNYINPCGLGNVKITSIKELLKKNKLDNSFNVNTLDIKIFKFNLGKDLFNKLSQ